MKGAEHQLSNLSASGLLTQRLDCHIPITTPSIRDGLDPQTSQNKHFLPEAAFVTVMRKTTNMGGGAIV